MFRTCCRYQSRIGIDGLKVHCGQIAARTCVAKQILQRKCVILNTNSLAGGTYLISRHRLFVLVCCNKVYDHSGEASVKGVIDRVGR